MQDASAQQVDLRSAIHLPLEELQSVDLALDLPAAPRRRECGPHRRQVRRRAARKAPVLRRVGLSCARQPSVESIDIATVYQAQELTGEAACLRDLRLDGAQGLDESSVLTAPGYLVPALAPTHQPSVGSLR